MQQHFGHMNTLMYANCDIQLSLCSQILVIIKQLQNNFNVALNSDLHNGNYKPKYKINKYTEDLNYEIKVYLQYANYFILSHCDLKNKSVYIGQGTHIIMFPDRKILSPLKYPSWQ